MIKRALILSCLSLTSLVLMAAMSDQAQAASSAEDSKERARLEELFIWKASEELKLPAGQETKFTEVIHSLGARRRKATERMEEAMRALGAAKNKPDAEKAILAHREAVKEYQAIQLAELDQLKALMGSEKMARYLIVKNEISEKLKELLAKPVKPSAAPVAPKIIEEK